VYGRAKQGAWFGHTKIAGKSILRRGLSPLAVTTTTPKSAPVLAGVRLRAGRAGSGKGAASMVTEAINTATAAGAPAQHILVRDDSAYCSGTVIAAVVKAGARFSFAIARDPRRRRELARTLIEHGARRRVPASGETQCGEEYAGFHAVQPR
jgi:hypothetical protein